MAQLFKDIVLKRQIGLCIADGALTGKAIALFVAGEDDDDLEDFIPQFLDAYLETRETCPELQVIFVSNDEIEGRLDRFFQKLPDDWFAIPYPDPYRPKILEMCETEFPDEKLPALFIVKSPLLNGKPDDPCNFVPVKRHFMMAKERNKLIRSWCDTYKHLNE